MDFIRPRGPNLCGPPHLCGNNYVLRPLLIGTREVPEGIRMVQPSEILREEHVVIEHLLGVLDGIAEHLDEGHPVPAKDLESALEVVVGFADRCHHAK